MKSLVVVALVVSGCGFADQDSVQLDMSGNVAEFSRFVQPVLQVGCASLDCHGDPGRPLRLYGRNGLRLDVALRGQDASDAEMLANMQAIAGLGPGIEQIEDHLLLLKPLSVESGGMHHGGGDLWFDQNALAYRCLHAWLRAGAADEAGQYVCSRALP